MMVFIMSLQVMEGIDISLKRPKSITLAVMDFIIVMIQVVTIAEVDICLIRPATLSLAILDQ